MKLKKFFLYLVVGSSVIVLFASLAPEAKAANPLDKAVRGLKNVVIAPAEIPVSIASEGKKNPFLGLTIGPLAGIVNCVTRATAGLLELVVSPLPPYDHPLYDRELGQTIWE